MRIFILDDEIHEPGGLQGRHRLKSILSNHILTLATSCPDGIEKYKPGQYDLLLLDHDMGGFIDNRPGLTNTGYEFCKWLVANEKTRVPVIIHSHNPVGKRNMARLLHEFGFYVEEHFYGRSYEQALEQKFGGA